jgi:quercetin dioxygenase-like cupin family protein
MTAATNEVIRIGGLVIRFLIDAETTGGALTAFAFEVPSQGTVMAAHSHDAYDETVYTVAGTLTWTVGGDEVQVGPGEVVFIPRGVVHRFENRGDEDVTAYAVVTPGILGPEYFREIAAVVDAAAGPPDPAAIGEVMRRHGLTPAPWTPHPRGDIQCPSS